jgi:hypothetical protein
VLDRWSARRAAWWRCWRRWGLRRHGPVIPLPDTAFNLILWVLGAFAAASVYGIIAGWTMPYKVANVEALEELRTKYWDDEEAVRARLSPSCDST